MSDDKLPFELDIIQYDWLILGTGYEETLYNAHLSKVLKSSNLILDFGNTYSSNIRTMNFKEFHKLDSELPTNQNLPYLHKRPIFTIVDPNQKQQQINQLFANQINSGQEFKHFNIDMQPKLLFSNSPSVSIMQQANLDQYMDFKAVENQFFYDQTTKTFKLTPTSKSDIFKCQFLTLSEKKQFFQLLHTLVKIFHKVINYQIDQNSTQEFDQNTTSLDEETYQKYLQYKDQQAVLFLNEITSKSLNKDKVYAILFYSICFITQSFHNQNNFISTEEFITKFGKCIKSMGIHSKSPFLYTNYGTGDIPQAFCRISAVHGSVFITQSQIRIYKIDKKDNEYLISSNLHQDQIRIKQGIIMCKQIYDSYIQLNQPVINQEHQSKQNYVLMRLILVTTKNQKVLCEEIRSLILDQLIEDQNTQHQLDPSIYVIPCKLFSNNPIYIFRADNNSNSAYKDYELFYVWTLLEEQNQIELKENLKQIIIDIDSKYNEGEEKSINYICYEKVLLQEMNKGEYSFQPNTDENIFVTTEDNDDLDLDAQTKAFMKNVQKVNVNFEENYYMVEKIAKEQQPQEQEMDNQQYILNQLMNIKQKE
ncbi:unnamed protein product [Paramecium sonneborni]|uniref:Rab proteins geranylgeranyltransferase component A n=1 Tax=Paramecium sonneborni TaxID=65129 RepID=A0A8S1RGK0_9CILI|nr:unnamed protein product [Paramecium sonneborni]